jgi:hypothetical protein
MSWEWLTLIGFTIVAVLLIFLRNTTFVKLNWKYFIILAPLVVLIILKIITGSKNKGDTGKVSGSTSEKDLGQSIGKLKEKLEEVQMETAIEVSAAKTKNEEVVKQLEEIKSIEDKTERRKRLAAMIG